MYFGSNYEGNYFQDWKFSYLFKVSELMEFGEFKIIILLKLKFQLLDIC